MPTYTDIAGKSLAIVCGCGRRVYLHDTFWNALARQCGNDVGRMEARLRCEACGSAGTIEVREPEPEPGYSDHQREVLGLIGTLMRNGRKAKKRGELL